MSTLVPSILQTPSAGEVVSSDARRLLRHLCAEAGTAPWVELHPEALIETLDTDLPELYGALLELKRARMVKLWALGSIVWLTASGRSLGDSPPD